MSADRLQQPNPTLLQGFRPRSPTQNELSGLAFQLAAGLTRYHDARVLLVDMDHQSSLSIVCLTGRNWQGAVQQSKTISEVFKPFIGQAPSLPGREIIERKAIKRVNNHNYDNLDIIPADLGLDDIEIDLTASHHGNAIQSEWDKRTLMCRWLEETGVDDDYDYIIFDCPPATKIVSQNAIAASHGYIIPVIPESVMERGAPHLVRMIQNGIDAKLNQLATLGTPRSMHVNNTNLVGVVVTRLKTHVIAQVPWAGTRVRAGGRGRIFRSTPALGRESRVA